MQDNSTLARPLAWMLHYKLLETAYVFANTVTMYLRLMMQHRAAPRPPHRHFLHCSGNYALSVLHNKSCGSTSQLSEVLPGKFTARGLRKLQPSIGMKHRLHSSFHVCRIVSLFSPLLSHLYVNCVFFLYVLLLLLRLRLYNLPHMGSQSCIFLKMHLLRDASI